MVRRFEARVAWWNRDFPKDEPPEPLPIAKSTAPATRARRGAGAAARARRQRPTADARGAEADGGSRCAARAGGARAGGAAAGDARQRSTVRRRARAKKAGGATGAATSISIALHAGGERAAAMKRLQAADAGDWRASTSTSGAATRAASASSSTPPSSSSPSEGDSRALGLRVLSNLAELDLQNRQVLRLLAYRLQQAGEVDARAAVFERVLELAPNEPQSHRDLGLALAEAGQAQPRSIGCTRSSPVPGTAASPTSS